MKIKKAANSEPIEQLLKAEQEKLFGSEGLSSQTLLSGRMTVQNRTNILQTPKTDASCLSHSGNAIKP
jgi:hypothetical protein